MLNLCIGDERYEQVHGQIRSDADLRARMWADAEHRFDEAPDKVWTVVIVREDGRWVPAAWAAAAVRHDGEEPVLVCSDGYERHGPGRRWGLYRVAYQHRHTTIVAPSPLPALTYLFEAPIRLHLADGWYRTGLSSTSREPGSTRTSGGNCAATPPSAPQLSKPRTPHPLSRLRTAPPASSETLPAATPRERTGRRVAGPRRPW